jgi:RND superfamily putative drug exporter
MSDTDAAPSLPIRLALERPWLVVGAWIAIIVVSFVVIATLLSSALNTEQVPTNDPQSMRGLDVAEAHLDEQNDVDEVLIVSSKTYQVNAPQFQQFLGKLAGQAGKVGVAVTGASDDGQAPAPGSEQGPPISKDGHAILVPLRLLHDEDQDARLKTSDKLVTAVDKADRDPDFAVEVTGDATTDFDITNLSQSDLEHGELYVGLPVALLVLLVVFGTVVGALMPLMIAFVGIITAVALTALVGQAWELNVFVINMISGMGLALGIDYSLFIVSRYREERQHGSTRDAAIRTTGATASRAVLFSGLTFVVALSGMLLVPTTIMRSLAAGAILVGITAVLAALTLLPATLHLLGDRVDSFAVPFIGRRRERGSGTHGFWPRLVQKVMRHPVLWGGTVAVLLLIAATPLLGMKTGAAGVGTLPEDLHSRQGYEALQANFPEQTFAPARVIVYQQDGIGQEAQRAIADLRDALAEDDRFGTVTEERSQDGKVIQVSVAVGADTVATRTVKAVRDLRDDVVPEAFGDVDGVDVMVTGKTSLFIDYFDVMSTWLPRVLGFVLGLSFLILLVVFRSIVVPIVAIVLNLLSVGATYGLLVLVFQHGVGHELLGFQHIDRTEAWVPLFLFSVLFGLSMDYHMFLLTRIRERWSHSRDTREAVAWGVGTTGRIITGAALIIVAVFLGFAIGDLVMFQQMGFGIGVALLIDATLVRGVLLPAAMAIIGEHNWYLPKWLEFLPEVQLEGDGHH